MQKTWVLVADTTCARIFTAEKQLGPLQELETLVHTEGRLHEQNLTSDSRPGRQIGGNAEGGHSMGHEDDPKKHEHIKFARDVCHFLDAAYTGKQFEKLYIVAAPSFLGALRNKLCKSVMQTVAEEISKNVTRMDMVTIRQLLPERL